MRQARAKGVTVSFDLNYRRTLWKWGKSAQQVLSEMIHLTDILIGNEEHLRLVIGLPERMEARELTVAALDKYRNLKAIAVSLREPLVAGQQYCWSACLNDRKEFLTGRRYDTTHSVDRIGAGDAFAAGLIYGWINLPDRQAILDFAVAAGCLKHSIPGDFCRATVDEVLALIDNSDPGRITADCVM